MSSTRNSPSPDPAHEEQAPDMPEEEQAPDMPEEAPQSAPEDPEPSPNAPTSGIIHVPGHAPLVPHLNLNVNGRPLPDEWGIAVSH